PRAPTPPPFPYTTLFRSHDLAEADPVLDVISVIEADKDGHFRVFASTSTEERAEVMDVAGRAINTKTPATARTPAIVMVAMPVRSEEHTSELQSRGHLVC